MSKQLEPLSGAVDEYTAAELVGIHDALRGIAAAAQQEQTPQSSVQIEQAAKPENPPRITVKCYSPMPGAAADMAQHLYDALVERYRQGGAPA